MLSESVGKALQLTDGPDVEETAKFVLMFDKFFDCLNVTNFTNAARKRKPFLEPYTSAEDVRLKVANAHFILLCAILLLLHVHFAPQWLEEDFLGYLQSWKESVEARHGYSDALKKRMQLSIETLQGIHRTGSNLRLV